MTVYRGTLCGWRDCPNVATHFLRLLAPKHGLPYDRRVPLDVLISTEVCAAHGDKAEFSGAVKAAGLVDQVQDLCRVQGLPPVDMAHAVVRLIRKDDGHYFQYPSR